MAIPEGLHPELARWIRGRFGAATAIQNEALPQLLEGRSTLVCSGTGTGKTLAGFLAVFDAIARKRDRKEPVGLQAVYLSPLRALAYDLARNLGDPIRDLGWDPSLVAVRTGDTSASERASQRRKPPAILVTTPESLALVAAQAGWSGALAGAGHAVVDELHALAENKRGTLLSLVLERMEALRPAGAPPLVRIGLSATIHPVGELAAFLTGGRPCALACAATTRTPDLRLMDSGGAPYPVSGYTGRNLVPALAEAVRGSRTCLIFTNTRAGAESLGLALRARLPDEAGRIEIHHASLDRDVRLSVEDRLKRGELKAVVCSTSLELGIDIGSVDLVVMVSAPKGVARAIQRVGRSGHAPDRSSRGLLMPTNLGDLAECAATRLLVLRGELERLRIPEAPADVLAQQLVGLAASGGWDADSAYKLVRGAWPYRHLERSRFDAVLRYLEGGGRALEGRYTATFGKIRVDATGRLEAATPRVIRDYWRNIGTIVSEAMVSVKLGQRVLGTVEESFAKGLRRGDVFVLGGRTLRLVETRLLAATVEEAKASLPTVPRWNANKLPLQSGVAAEVSRLRTRAAELIASGGLEQLRRMLAEEYALDCEAAESLARHFRRQAEVSEIPTIGRLLIETCQDGDRTHHCIHSLVGRAANDALSRILAWRYNRILGGNALVTIDDYGILLTVGRRDSPGADVWRRLLERDAAESALEEALADSDLVKWHFRACSQTGLMVPRTRGQAERGPRQLQWSSEVIFEVLRRHEPGHPLLQEAVAEAKFRFLDLEQALTFLGTLATWQISLRDLERVSPFAFPMHASLIKETMMLEDPEDAIERLYHKWHGGR